MSSFSFGSLIRSGAVTSAVDERGETPLHVAAAMGRRAVAQTLLLFDADIDHRYDARLHTYVALKREHFLTHAPFLCNYS